jgi:hypothetical protein
MRGRFAGLLLACFATISGAPAFAQSEGLAMAPIDGTDGRSPTPQMQGVLNETAQARLADKKAAQDLAASLSLACRVTEAILVAQGPSVVDGTAVSTKTYEAACSNGMGYFLVDQPPVRPTFHSCFGALRKTAIGTREVGCRLLANANLMSMASAAIAQAGASCAVQDLSRIGESANMKLEYVETRCREGSGYILAVGLPGSKEALRVVDCAGSLPAFGVACRLAANAAQANVVTDETFREALVSRGVPCDVTAIHPIGQQAGNKRYVVEFKCAQTEAPHGLVAFIPLAGNDSPFQMVTCPTAAKAGITCKFAAAN